MVIGLALPNFTHLNKNTHFFNIFNRIDIIKREMTVLEKEFIHYVKMQKLCREPLYGE
jgi:hypothetical protein